MRVGFTWAWDGFGLPAIAFSGLVKTEGTMLSGFFLKKKPPFNALKKSTCIPKMLWKGRGDRKMSSFLASGAHFVGPRAEFVV
jgi:hypothetical protein